MNKIIKRYGIDIFLLILAVVTQLLDIWKDKIPKIVTPLILASFALIDGIAKIIQEKGNTPAQIGKEVAKSLDEEINAKALKKEKKENAKRNEIVATLINKGWISPKRIEKEIEDEKFIMLYISPKKIPLKKRLYPEELEKMGFIRLEVTGKYWVSSERNLPKKLRDLNVLSEYLLFKSGEWVKKEMDELKKENEEEYKKTKGKNSIKNFNILVTKSNLQNLKHRFTQKNSFNPEFKEELISASKIQKLKLSEEEKVKLKKIISKAHLEILLEKIPQPHKIKFNEIEPKLTQKLNIRNFYDFRDKNKDDIKSILKSKFNDNLSEEYAKLLINKSKEFSKALSELGVELS